MGGICSNCPGCGQKTCTRTNPYCREGQQIVQATQVRRTDHRAGQQTVQAWSSGSRAPEKMQLKKIKTPRASSPHKALSGQTRTLVMLFDIPFCFKQQCADDITYEGIKRLVGPPYKPPAAEPFTEEERETHRYISDVCNIQFSPEELRNINTKCNWGKWEMFRCAMLARYKKDFEASTGSVYVKDKTSYLYQVNQQIVLQALEIELYANPFFVLGEAGTQLFRDDKEKAKLFEACKVDLKIINEVRRQYKLAGLKEQFERNYGFKYDTYGELKYDSTNRTGDNSMLVSKVCDMYTRSGLRTPSQGQRDLLEHLLVKKLKSRVQLRKLEEYAKRHGIRMDIDGKGLKGSGGEKQTHEERVTTAIKYMKNKWHNDHISAVYKELFNTDLFTAMKKYKCGRRRLWSGTSNSTSSEVGTAPSRRLISSAPAAELAESTASFSSSYLLVLFPILLLLIAFFWRRFSAPRKPRRTIVHHGSRPLYQNEEIEPGINMV